jgi:hypothetical protein
MEVVVRAKRGGEEITPEERKKKEMRIDSTELRLLEEV